MESIPRDIVSLIGLWLKGSERRVCLETAKCFQPICHLNHAHYFEFLRDVNKVSNLLNTINYVKKIKSNCKHIMFVFWNVTSIDDSQVISLQQALAMAKMETYDLHIHKCSSQVRSTLLKCFEPYRIRNLSIIFKAIHDCNPNPNELNIFDLETLELYLHNQQFNLLNNSALMSKVTHILITSMYSSLPPSINLEHLTNANLKEVLVDVAQPHVYIRGAERITHLIMRDLLNEDVSADASLVRYLCNNDKLRLKTMTMIDERARNNNNYSVMNNYWYVVMRVLSKTLKDTCTFQYLTPSYNGYVIPMLQKMMELNSNVEYLYKCDETYMISKVIKKLIPNINCRPFVPEKYTRVYSPPEEIQNIDDFKGIYEQLDDTTKPFWFWLAH